MKCSRTRRCCAGGFIRGSPSSRSRRAGRPIAEKPLGAGGGWRPVAPAQAALRSECEERDLPPHDRRAVAARSVRKQTDAGAAPRRDVSCGAARGEEIRFIGGQPTFAGSRYAFARHGQSGHEFSELLPHLAGVSDELTFIRSLHTEEINHAPAQLFLHTGFGRGGRPSFGSWVTYGLGTENQDPP